MDTLLIRALLIGEVIWLITRLFRRSFNASNASSSRAQQGPDFLPNRSAGLGSSVIGGSGMGVC